ncbi:MAG: response regulator transcription factor [Xenococcaceae cyanobacterium MO_188.B32]|nr:response regulator transcription factor [Xenococcaceae cyanobacterium MO_188.B32]
MIRVLVADDQNLIRQALQIYLENEGDIQVIVSVDNGIKAIEEIEKHHPDVAVIDLEMPGIDGLTTIKIIRQRFPQTKVLVLSSHDSQECVNQALQVGANGYMLKNSSAEELATVIRSIAQGYFQLAPGLYEKISKNFGSNNNEDLRYIEQELNERLEDIQVEFNQVIDSENNKLREEIFNKIHEETSKIRNEMLLDIDVNLNDIKAEVEQGLRVFQQKVFQQMQDEWGSFRGHIESQGLSNLNNSLQEQKMIRVQLMQLRESYQQLENKLGTLYKLFLISLLAIIVMFLMISF